MRKSIFAVVFAIFAGAAAAAVPTLDIVGDKVQDVTVGGKVVKFDGAIKEIAGSKVMAFGEKPFALPGKTLVGQSGSIVMEYAIDTRQSKNGARPLVCLRLESNKQIAFFTFHGNPVIQLRFGDPLFFDRNLKLAANRIYQSAVTWDGEKVCFYLDGKLLYTGKQPLPVKTANINNITVGPFSDPYFKTPTWDNDCFMKRLQVFNTALTAEEIAKLNK